MKKSFPHDLGLARAKVVAEAALESYKAKHAEYKPTYYWLDERKADIHFQVKIVKLNGCLEVCDTSINFELEVPFYLRAFQAQAESVVAREIAIWVKKAESGEL